MHFYFRILILNTSNIHYLGNFIVIIAAVLSLYLFLMLCLTISAFKQERLQQWGYLHRLAERTHTHNATIREDCDTHMRDISSHFLQLRSIEGVLGIGGHT